MMYAAAQNQKSAEWERARAHQAKSKDQAAPAVSRWVADPTDPKRFVRGEYVNRDSGRAYTPHNADEQRFVESDSPRYGLLKGGEGSGKSVAGIIKALERLRRGMNGIMVSPDFPHFKRSLWMEFVRWCPPTALIEKDRYRLAPGWEPSEPFTLTFVSGAVLLCGGIENPASWEGPNVNFVLFDEARRHKDPLALKVLDGRIRIQGRQGEPPQLFMTTTPRKHWLFEYFGPLITDGPDPYEAFKRAAMVVTLRTLENESNTFDGYATQRSSSLTENERRVLLDAEWEDADDIDRFLASIDLWDACIDRSLPPLGPHEPCVMALDAGESSDTFAKLLITRHPTDPARLAVRKARAYVPKDEPLDFDAIEKDIRDDVDAYAVQELTYDPFLLGQMMRRLSKPESKLPVPLEPFPQGAQRLISDRALGDSIAQRTIAHDGTLEDLRTHLNNADKKTTEEGRKVRIVKRMASLKIDLAVALGMGAWRADEVLPQTIMDAPIVGGSRPNQGWVPRGAQR